MAGRNVWRNGRRSMFLAGTVAIGTMALLLFVAYIAATAEGLKESIVRGGTGHLQIGKIGQFDGYEEEQLQFGLSPQERDEVQRVLANDRRVRRVVPRLAFGGLVSNGQRTLTFQGTGTDPNKERQAFGIFQNIKAGEALQGGDDAAYNAVLGQEMARRLGVKPGDTVTLMTSTVFGSINAIDVTVAGITATGNPESDLYVLQVPLAAAQDLLRTKKVSRLVVLLKETADTAPVQESLKAALSGKAEVRDWRTLVPIFEQVLTLYKNQFIVFGVIICIVVFLGVSTMTLTNIFERSKEIGTMRAIGLAAAKIRVLFTIEGMMQGMIGVVLGLLLAGLFSWFVGAVGVTLPPPPGRNLGVPLRLLWVPQYAASIMIALPIISTVAALVISRRISRMPVVQALTDSH